MKIKSIQKALGLATATALSFAAWADATWTGNAGDNSLSTAGNWSGGTPAGNKVLIYKDAGPLSLSSDMASNEILFGDGTTPANVVLDFGDINRIWKVNAGNTRFFVKKGSTLTIKSGRLQSNARIFIGDNYPNATCIVDGPNSILYGSSNTSGANYIQVGSSNDGKVSFDNLLKVQNGGKVRGWLVMGRLAQKVEFVTCGTNTVLVTGEGSMFEGIGATSIGVCQGLSHFLVDEGATATMASLNIGTCDKTTQFADYNVSGPANEVRIRNGATLTVEGETAVGDYSCSNLLEVASGAKVTLKGLVSTSKSHDDSFSNKMLPFANTIRATGSGSELTLRGGLKLGRTENAHGDAVEVLDGGRVVFGSKDNAYFDYYIGVNKGSRDLRILVDGGTLDANTNTVSFYLGRATCGNVMTVTNNGIVKTAMLSVGSVGNEPAASNRVEVMNGGELSVNYGVFYLGHCWDGVETKENVLHIGKGGKFVHRVHVDAWTNDFNVGRGIWASGNRVKVEGELAFNNGGRDEEVFIVGKEGRDNRFEVVNGGTAKVEHGGFVLGFAASATNNVAYIGTNSELVVANTARAVVGIDGYGSSLVVDGGTLGATTIERIVIGGGIAGENATFVVKNGATVNVPRIVLGDKAPNSTMVVSNATVNLAAYGNRACWLDIGYSVVSAGVANPANATLVIAGRDARVNVGYNIRMRNPTAKIRFVVPAEGFAQTPLVCAGGFEAVEKGASIHVSAEAGWPVGSRATLLEVKYATNFDNLTLTADEGLRILRKGGKIVAKKISGLAVIVR